MTKYQKQHDASDLVQMAKALAHRSRIRALYALEGRELCVCQIVELLQLAPSTVSKHMSILRKAGLVVSQKRGRWVYYRLPDPAKSPAVNDALEWATTYMRDTRQGTDDRDRLEEILETDPEELCRMQNEN
ncbi:MAG: ArsR/SmtB family transcription factor [Candidatus Brocadiia bacterium]